MVRDWTTAALAWMHSSPTSAQKGQRHAPHGRVFQAEGGCQWQTHVLPAGKQSHRLEAAVASHWAQFQEMSAKDREMVESMMTDLGMDVDPLHQEINPGLI
ncbi:hypothetical protein EV424DRAFT_1349243 [Suillus variegatus]|nr:hypothetical protein EV424DRAFT_1349243 [Suillus variegatus]